MIGKLSWRNLWRNRTRSVITMASISFAVLLAVLMQSLQKGIFDNLIKNVVSFYSGYLQVHKSGYWNEQILDNGFQYHDSLKQKMLSIPGITGMVPRLENFMLVTGSNSTRGCLLVGTDPVEENRLTHLGEKVVAGTYFDSNQHSVLIAEGLAQKLSLAVNDTLVVIGQGYQGNIAAGKFPIQGILHFGSPELNDGLVYLQLNTLQELLSAQLVLTSLVLNLDNPLQLHDLQDKIQKNLSADYEIMNWEELLPEISNHIKADGASLSIFTGFLYLIIGFGIFGTILMMTIERKREFGMLIAIGMKKLNLAIMLLQETLWISILGVLVGLILSLPATLYFYFHPMRLGGEMAKMYEQFGFEPLFPTAIDPQIFLKESLLVLILAAILGLYPLWFVKSIKPVEAMKR